MNLFTILITFFLATRVDLMHENITGTIALKPYRIFSICSIIIIASIYAYQTHRLYYTLHHDRKKYHYLINLTWIIMIVGALSPYKLNKADLLSELHVFCSMTSCIIVLVLLFIYTRLLSLENIQKHKKIHWYYDIGIIILFMLFFLFSRVNGYLEITYSCIVSGYFIVHHIYEFFS